MPITIPSVLHILIYLILSTTQIKYILILPKLCWERNRHKDVKLLVQSYIVRVTKDQIYTKDKTHSSVSQSFLLNPFPRGHRHLQSFDFSAPRLAGWGRALEMIVRLLLAYVTHRQDLFPPRYLYLLPLPSYKNIYSHYKTQKTTL